MKKVVLFGLLLSLIGSLVFVMLELKKYNVLKEEVKTLKNEVSKTQKYLDDVPTNISILEKEKEELLLINDNQIKQYKKWEKQNQVLDNLLK